MNQAGPAGPTRWKQTPRGQPLLHCQNFGRVPSHCIKCVSYEAFLFYSAWVILNVNKRKIFVWNTCFDTGKCQEGFFLTRKSSWSLNPLISQNNFKEGNFLSNLWLVLGGREMIEGSAKINERFWGQKRSHTMHNIFNDTIIRLIFLCLNQNIRHPSPKS